MTVVAARRVLVVDDSLFMRTLLKDILDGNGFEVVGEATTAEEAVERFRALKPDLVTMDVTLDVEEPHTGLDAARRILAEIPSARVVMVTAVDQPDVREEARALGAAGFLGKPFRDDEVVAALAAALGR